MNYLIRCLLPLLLMSTTCQAQTSDETSGQNKQGALSTEQVVIRSDLLCPNIKYAMDEDGRFLESELTEEHVRFSLDFLRNELPKWMDNRFQSAKKFPDTFNALFDGEIGMAYHNHLTIIQAYFLKMEAMSAGPNVKTKAQNRFCDYLKTQVRID